MALNDSGQKWLTRNRPPRVKITYDVEIGNAIEKKELPFVMGVMADLAGATAMPPLKDRKFVEIDRDNFNDVMGAISPTVAFSVPNRLDPAGEAVGASLTFQQMDDFEPAAVLRQVPQLAALYEKRRCLRDLLTKLDGNDRLAALLREAAVDKLDEIKKALPAPAAAE